MHLARSPCVGYGDDNFISSCDNFSPVMSVDSRAIGVGGSFACNFFLQGVFNSCGEFNCKYVCWYRLACLICNQSGFQVGPKLVGWL